jgi:DNA mismatch repair ATPase MutS
MKAFLMYRQQDVNLQQPLPPHAQALIQDLELSTLFNAMAHGDKLIFEAVQKAIVSSVSDLDTIHYRQQILQDCLKNASVVRAIYALAGNAIAEEKKHYLGSLNKYPNWILHRSLEVLHLFVALLRKLKAMADEDADAFESEGFTTFFAMLRTELSEDYFASIQQHLSALKFRHGVLMSAALGQGNKGTKYVLRHLASRRARWKEWIFPEKTPSYTFFIADRDERGARALSELKDRGINLVANALAQSADHILSFFVMLRTELAFYVGCINLHEHLGLRGMPVSFPLPLALGKRRLAFQGLYDVCLALTTHQCPVSNDMQANQKDLVIITGANQGGKSTFLRSLGLAQLMMQCGMFVPAGSFCANVCQNLFTHYRRKEDATMKSGKLDEELSRMSEMVNYLTPHALVLLNESFAATNEREGSEIARQIICALLEKGIEVFFVTHLYELAHGLYGKRLEHALFLRAERQNDGKRTFKIVTGEPLPTSYGTDVYHQIFEEDQCFSESPQRLIEH